MQPIRMRRGFNNTFYYVQQDLAGNDKIMELIIEDNKTKFEWKLNVAFEMISGHCLCLEMDPDNFNVMDSGPSSDKDKDNQFIEQAVSNELYFIDDTLQMYQIKQGEESYNVIEKDNLADIQAL